MTEKPSAAEFAALAEELALERTGEELEALLTRIAASPVSHPAGAWRELIAPDIAERTVDRLVALIDRLKPNEGEADPSRLDRLREALKRAGVDGFILPRADEHLGEYIPAPAQRLSWLTGFTGSAGAVLVLRDTATLFVDGRYTLQAANQVDSKRWTVEHLIRTPPVDVIRQHLAGGSLGYDPKLHSVTATNRLRDAAASASGRLVPLEPNPIDELWNDRPPEPLGVVSLLDVELTGLSAATKREQIAAELRRRGAEATVLNQPESIAWLLNLRGGDVPYTPLPLAYAILGADAQVELFLDEAKCTASTRAALGNQVTLRPFEQIGDALGDLGSAGARVAVDPDSATDWLHGKLTAAGAQVVNGQDPCILPRARKNTSELAGTRAAHGRDAVAMARFLKWIDDEAQSGAVSERTAADALEAFRSGVENWRGPSFPSISGAGPNGAIVHYRVTAETDRALEAGNLYLIDSGAQYLDGTTDITRTIAIGRPTEEMRERFTLVLKGHIAIATARFPAGTTGGQLDALARQHLWRAGLDFDHGTGHGVGVFLGVHEGPQRISGVSSTPIEAGMILSNEPGYYKPDAYGIRIENLVIAVESTPLQDSGRAMLAFETITFAPIDRRLIETAIMTPQEVAWLDAYHREVCTRVAPHLDSDGRHWLEAATAPLDTSAS